MRKLIHGAACALGVAAAFGSAKAADLPSLKGPPIPPPPAFTWTGLYGGLNIGYAFGDGAAETGALGYGYGGVFSPAVPLGSTWSIGRDLNGVAGGGQVGYNYQFNPWLVLGLEADIQATNAESHANTAIGVLDVTGLHLQTVNSTKNVDWFGTVRGRVGFTLPSWPNLMVYGTGGFAYGQVVHNVGFADNYIAPPLPGFLGGAFGHGYSDSTKTGWTAGGGVEWSPSQFPSWSLKAEYLYVDLGSTTANSVPLNGGWGFPGLAPVFAATQHSPTRFHNIRLGVNWHFDPFAPTLVSTAGGALPSVKGPPPAFVDSYQPFQVRLKVAGVIPLNGHGTVYDQGAASPALGGGAIGFLTGLTSSPCSTSPITSTRTGRSKPFAALRPITSRARAPSPATSLAPGCSRPPSWRNITSPISAPSSPILASA
jgi:outer membrane immunogenic protein